MSKTHYLVITYPSWAHIRSELGLCATLLSLNPTLHMTILVPSSRYKAAQIEFEQYHLPETAFERTRWIHYGVEKQNEGEGMFNIRGGFREQNLQELQGWAEKLVRLEDVTDTVTGQPVSPFPMPFNLIITDITLGQFSAEVKGLMGKVYPEKAVPDVLAFGPYNAIMLANISLVEYSQFLPRCHRVFDEAKTDEERMKLYNELIGENEEILHFPRLSPLHYYELDPVEKESALIRILPNLYRLGRAITSMYDGLILGWPARFTEEIAPAMAKQFKAFYPIGPSIPPTAETEWTVETSEGECKAYLDKALKEDGPKSVLYISFGSVLFAPTTEQFAILLDVLEELSMPFILAQGNQLEGNCPPEVRDLMKARVGKGRNRGLLLTWAPQKAVLQHPATGIFLTHGGSNSALEAILYEVPMVMWPSGFDQPSIANETETMGIAKELFQIRNGPNIGRTVARNNVLVEGTSEAIHREFKEVFTSLLGEGGSEMRERLRQVSEEVQRDKKQGSSHDHLVHLANIGRE